MSNPSRVRNARTGKWIDLPPPTPQGMVWARIRTIAGIILKLMPIEDVQRFHAAQLCAFDLLPPKERWRINYCRATSKLSALPFPTDPPQWSKTVSPLSIDDLGL